jgi:hypothetical protein
MRVDGVLLGLSAGRAQQGHGRQKRGQFDRARVSWKFHIGFPSRAH